MDQELVDASIDYHGPKLVDQLASEQVDVALPNFLTLSNDNKRLDTPRDEEFEEKVAKFISRKADLVFLKLDSEISVIEDIDISEQDHHAVVPPLEAFMDVPAPLTRDHLYQSLEKGDIVVGVLTAVQESGLTLTLLCLDQGKVRDIDHLKVTAFCPIREVPRYYAHESPLEGFALKDKVRGIVVQVSPAQERIIVSLQTRALPPPLQHIKIGVISEEQMPLHFKRLQTIGGRSYSGCLEGVLGFMNTGNVDHLMHRLSLGAGDLQPSLMRGLFRKSFPKEECAEALRKQQSHRWSLKSVEEGIIHFKEGRMVEAFQLLNKALQIDPENVEALVAKGALYANSENYNRALQDFEAALKLNANHPNARKYMCETLLVKGRSMLEQADEESSIEYYQRALDLDPTLEEAIAVLDKLRDTKAVELVENDVELEEEDDEAGLKDGSGQPPQQEDGASSLSKTQQTLRRLIHEEKSVKPKKKKKKKKGSIPKSPPLVQKQHSREKRRRSQVSDSSPSPDQSWEQEKKREERNPSPSISMTEQREERREASPRDERRTSLTHSVAGAGDMATGGASSLEKMWYARQGKLSPASLKFLKEQQVNADIRKMDASLINPEQRQDVGRVAPHLDHPQQPAFQSAQKGDSADVKGVIGRDLEDNQHTRRFIKVGPYKPSLGPPKNEAVVHISSSSNSSASSSPSKGRRGSRSYSRSPRRPKEKVYSDPSKCVEADLDKSGRKLSSEDTISRRHSGKKFDQHSEKIKSQRSRSRSRFRSRSPSRSRSKSYSRSKRYKRSISRDRKFRRSRSYSRSYSCSPSRGATSGSKYRRRPSGSSRSRSRSWSRNINPYRRQGRGFRSRSRSFSPRRARPRSSSRHHSRSPVRRRGAQMSRSRSRSRYSRSPVRRSRSQTKKYRRPVSKGTWAASRSRSRSTSRSRSVKHSRSKSFAAKSTGPKSNEKQHKRSKSSIIHTADQPKSPAAKKRKLNDNQDGEKTKKSRDEISGKKTPSGGTAHVDRPIVGVQPRPKVKDPGSTLETHPSAPEEQNRWIRVQGRENPVSPPEEVSQISIVSLGRSYFGPGVAKKPEVRDRHLMVHNLKVLTADKSSADPTSSKRNIRPGRPERKANSPKRKSLDYREAEQQPDGKSSPGNGRSKRRDSLDKSDKKRKDSSQQRPVGSGKDANGSGGETPHSDLDMSITGVVKSKWDTPEDERKSRWDSSPKQTDSSAKDQGKDTLEDLEQFLKHLKTTKKQQSTEPAVKK